MSNKALRWLAKYLISCFALFCFAPISIPSEYLPVTLQTLVLCIIGYWFGWSAFWATITYIVVGLFGLPIFSGYTSNPAILRTSSAGFVVGFPMLVASITMLRKAPPRFARVLLLFITAHLILLLFAFLYNTAAHYSYPPLAYIIENLTPSLLVKSTIAAFVVTFIQLPKKLT